MIYTAGESPPLSFCKPMRIVIEQREWKWISRVLIMAFVVVLGSTIYTNYFLPHGPSYDTGDVVCENDGRGPCHEAYKEDLRNVNIPNWAKYMRNYGAMSVILLAVASVVTYSISKEEKTS